MPQNRVITEPQLAALLNVSRQRLQQLRAGYKSKGYEYPPVLVEGKHWRHCECGGVLYRKAGIEKARELLCKHGQ